MENTLGVVAEPILQGGYAAADALQSPWPWLLIFGGAAALIVLWKEL